MDPVCAAPSDEVLTKILPSIDHTLHSVPSFLVWLASFIKSLRKGVRFSLMYNRFEAKAVAAGQWGESDCSDVWPAIVGVAFPFFYKEEQRFRITWLKGIRMALKSAQETIIFLRSVIFPHNSLYIHKLSHTPRIMRLWSQITFTWRTNHFR